MKYLDYYYNSFWPEFCFINWRPRDTWIAENCLKTREDERFSFFFFVYFVKVEDVYLFCIFCCNPLS